MTHYSIQVAEYHCCGGGHCGNLPGYKFTCPLCHENVIVRTGDPLEIDAIISCTACRQKLQLIRIDASNLFTFTQVSSRTFL